METRGRLVRNRRRAKASGGRDDQRRGRMEVVSISLISGAKMERKSVAPAGINKVFSSLYVSPYGGR